MPKGTAGLSAGALLIASCWSLGLQAADTSTVTYPFLGVTHIFRVGSAPDFPRNVRMHIVKIDLTAPFLSFKLPPRGGTRARRHASPTRPPRGGTRARRHASRTRPLLLV